MTQRDELLGEPLAQLWINGEITAFRAAAYVPSDPPQRQNWALLVTDADPPITPNVESVQFRTRGGLRCVGRAWYENQRQLKYLTVLLKGADALVEIDS